VRRLFALLRVQSRASLALAALLSLPLYLAALLASSLALDRPRLVGVHEHPPASGTEAKVWVAALIVPAILLAVGAVALLVRRHGLYLSALAGAALCFAIPPLAHGWIGRHERRFPLGMDFVKDSSPSNLSSRGDWEHAAYDTIVSITHWTLVLAVGAIVVGVVLEIRRRRGSDAIAVPPPPLETVTGGAPEVTGPR
jgi:hypothetical protein